MAPNAFKLSAARVLLSNDDGIHAPGLKLLARIMRPLVRELWVVAPEEEQSAASHSLTLRRPLRVRKLSPRRFAVSGTPTDAVLLAVSRVMKGRRPDLVLSGINRGANLGEDVTYSGTVAAAMEATLLGIPAVALSQVAADGHPVKWATAEHHLPTALKRLTAAGWPAEILININFPNVLAPQVTGIEITRQGRRKLGGGIVDGVDPRGEPYFWIGPQRSEGPGLRGSDLDAVAHGAISVTPLSLDLTYRPTLAHLRRALA